MEEEISLDMHASQLAGTVGALAAQLRVVPGSADPAPMGSNALRWENAANGHYYQAMALQNLWGEWELWRGWGRAGSKLGGQRRDPAADGAAALRALAAVAARRERRGYRRRRP
jgi:predicted DNA-binding WGR domain protein